MDRVENQPRPRFETKLPPQVIRLFVLASSALATVACGVQAKVGEVTTAVSSNPIAGEIMIGATSGRSENALQAFGGSLPLLGLIITVGAVGYTLVGRGQRFEQERRIHNSKLDIEADIADYNAKYKRQ